MDASCGGGIRIRPHSLSPLPSLPSRKFRARTVARIPSGFLEVLTAFRAAVEARGGEFRIGTYPDTGHDAWSKAWREPALWDWLFFSPIVRTWSRMAGFGRDTGLCRFTAREPFRFLRIVIDADAASPLVIREAHVE